MLHGIQLSCAKTDSLPVYNSAEGKTSDYRFLHQTNQPLYYLVC